VLEKPILRAEWEADSQEREGGQVWKKEKPERGLSAHSTMTTKDRLPSDCGKVAEPMRGRQASAWKRGTEKSDERKEKEPHPQLMKEKEQLKAPPRGGALVFFGSFSQRVLQNAAYRAINQEAQVPRRGRSLRTTTCKEGKKLPGGGDHRKKTMVGVFCKPEKKRDRVRQQQGGKDRAGEMLQEISRTRGKTAYSTSTREKKKGSSARQ